MVPDGLQSQLGSLLGREIPCRRCLRPLAPMLTALPPHIHAIPSDPMPRSAAGLTCPAKSPQTPMMHRILNTAEPTMVPTPTSPFVMKTPETDLMSAWLLWPVAFQCGHGGVVTSVS